MKVFLFTFSLILAGITSITPYATAQETASAEQLDPRAQKKEELRTIIQHFLDEMKKDTPDLIFKGDILVEDAGGYFAVTFPHISAEFEGEDDEKARLDFGIISLNAVPDSQEGQWKMTYALPTPIRLSDGAGKTMATFSIGGQKISGIWNQDFGYFIKLDGAYDNIDIAFFNEKQEKALIFKAASSQFSQDLKEQDGLWSGPSGFTLKDVSIAAENDVFNATLDSYALKIDMDRYDPDLAKKNKDMIRNADAQNNKQFFSFLKDMIEKTQGGFKSSHSITGLQAAHTDDAGNKAEFGLSSAMIGMDVIDVDKKNAQIAFKLGYDGLKPSGPLSDFNIMLPLNNHISLQANNIPLQDITKLLVQTLEENAAAQERLDQQDLSKEAREAQEKALGMAQMGKVMQIPALLAEAGTTLDLDLKAGNDNYDMVYDALAKVDVTAVNSATLDSTLTFFDLVKIKDLIAGELSKLQKPKDEMGAQELQYNLQKVTTMNQALQALSLIQTIAETKTENGRNAHILEIIMNKQGRFTINGQDAQALIMPMIMGAAMQSMQAAPPAAPNAENKNSAQDSSLSGQDFPVDSLPPTQGMAPSLQKQAEEDQQDPSAPATPQQADQP